MIRTSVRKRLAIEIIYMSLVYNSASFFLDFFLTRAFLEIIDYKYAEETYTGYSRQSSRLFSTNSMQIKSNAMQQTFVGDAKVLHRYLVKAISSYLSIINANNSYNSCLLINILFVVRDESTSLKNS